MRLSQALLGSPNLYVNNDRLHAGLNEGALETVMQLPPLVLQALAFAVDYLKPFQHSPGDGTLRQYPHVRPSLSACKWMQLLENSNPGGNQGCRGHCEAQQHRSLLWPLEHSMTVLWWGTAIMGPQAQRPCLQAAGDSAQQRHRRRARLAAVAAGPQHDCVRGALASLLGCAPPQGCCGHSRTPRCC
jgi:hypothetical protein